MILDGFHAILDQGSGNLIVFDEIVQDVSLNFHYLSTDIYFCSQETYDSSIATLKELSTVVDRLYVKAKRLAV
jgi:hypothetical protein